MRSLIVAVWISCATVFLGGCVTNATTGRSQILMMSWQEEAKIGAEAVPQLLEESGGEIPDQALTQYVNGVVMDLVEVAKGIDPKLKELTWEVYVVNTDVVNAFALPGGKVFVTRGILKQMTNEAQLAGVMGHEIGHVSARHGNERITKTMGVQALVITGNLLADKAVESEVLSTMIGVGANAGGQLFLLKYSRDNEYESDELGVRYMVECGYHPRGQVQVMELLNRLSGGGGQIEWLSTHPAPKKRIQDLEALIAKKYPEASSVGTYQFYETRYKKQVLDRLEKLPAGKPQSMISLSQAIAMCDAEGFYFGGETRACGGDGE